MSGHSKWATIKRAKGVTDARRGQLFTKLVRELSVAARQGGPSVEANFRLRLAVQKARDNNMPLENIERAIKRGAGSGEGGAGLSEINYEGYAPGGAALLVAAVTDNKNRTTSDIRSVLTRHGGNLGEAGCVAWNFESRGVIFIEAAGDKAEDLALLSVDAGAEDFKLEDGSLEVYTQPSKLEAVRKALESTGAKVASAEVAMVPKATVTLDDKSALQALKLMDRLEELDDVQKVYTNADFPDQVLEAYRSQA